MEADPARVEVSCTLCAHCYSEAFSDTSVLLMIFHICFLCRGGQEHEFSSQVRLTIAYFQVEILRSESVHHLLIPINS